MEAGDAFAGLVAPAIDRVFRSAIALPRPHTREVALRYCDGRVPGPLVEFRTALGWPGRTVTPSHVAAVLRYRDPDELRPAVAGHVDGGLLEVDPDGGFRATGRGRDFLGELLAVQGTVLSEHWRGHEVRMDRLVEVTGRVLAEAGATGGEAFAAMAPPYEPAGTVPPALLLNRLGTLRYHRADAHAAAWQAAGLTAAQIQTMPAGPERATIEAETDRLAAPPYAGLALDEKFVLLADLAALP
jgi:hypothetical protein